VEVTLRLFLLLLSKVKNVAQPGIEKICTAGVAGSSHISSDSAWMFLIIILCTGCPS